MKCRLVVDLGGSLVYNTSGINVSLLKEIYRIFSFWLSEDPQRKLALVIGGGSLARQYQQALQKLAVEADNATLDRQGIAATLLNASLVREIFAEFTPPEVISSYDNLLPTLKDERLLVGGGWKPGFSTDYVCVLLAQHLCCSQIVRLSNVKQIYDKDPKKYPQARAYKNLSWQEYGESIAATSWVPGAHTPFDPHASSLAAAAAFEIVFLQGEDTENISRFLSGKPFCATVINEHQSSHYNLL